MASDGRSETANQTAALRLPCIYSTRVKQITSSLRTGLRVSCERLGNSTACASVTVTFLKGSDATAVLVSLPLAHVKKRRIWFLSMMSNLKP